MQVKKGHKVLDIGCGPGLDTIPLGHLVGPSGQVIGVDYDPRMLAEADRESHRAGVSGWVVHRQADATALPFATGHFDACYSERVLQHVPRVRATAVLAEAVRVTKPGGWVVAIDTDWGSFSVDSDEVSIERRIMLVHASRFANGYSGRRLYRQLRYLGLLDFTVEMFGLPLTFEGANRLLAFSEQLALAQGVITPEEWGRWRTSIALANQYGSFFGHLTLIAVAGRKP